MFLKLVNTPDEVTGQFTIPGRGTFNVVNTDASGVNNHTGVRLRNVGNTSQSTSGAAERSSNRESTGSATTSRNGPSTTASPPVHDQGDPNEEPVNIRVRFLDESVQACSFRPSQSLGDFKCKLIMQTKVHHVFGEPEKWRFYSSKKLFC